MKKAIITVLAIGAMSLVGASEAMCAYFLKEGNKTAGLILMAKERGDSDAIRRSADTAIYYYENAISECEAEGKDVTAIKKIRKTIMEMR